MIDQQPPAPTPGESRTAQKARVRAAYKAGGNPQDIAVREGLATGQVARMLRGGLALTSAARLNREEAARRLRATERRQRRVANLLQFVTSPVEIARVMGEPAEVIEADVRALREAHPPGGLAR